MSTTGYEQQHIFAAAAKEAGLDSNMTYAVMNAMNEHWRAAENLKAACEVAIDKAQITIKRVDAGGHVNSLGEDQGAGARIDTYCGKYEATIDALVGLAGLLPKDVADNIWGRPG